MHRETTAYVLMTGPFCSVSQEQFAVNYYGADSDDYTVVPSNACLPARPNEAAAGTCSWTPQCGKALSSVVAGHWYLTQLMIDTLRRGADAVHRPSRVVWVSCQTLKCCKAHGI